MIALAKALAALSPRPDLVVVPGDVNSTLAAALVATKLHLPVAHVEAGLRSFDRSMPEEVNRVAVDHVADLLLTPSPDADENLAREGIPAARVRRVGNLMIDTLRRHLPAARARAVPEALGLAPGRFAVLTLHRPSNVDDPEVLRGLLGAVAELARTLPVVFPVHPRTRARLPAGTGDGLVLVEPMGYLEFLSLTSAARLVLTDSGGLQEETTALGVPCLTLRENTERPVTCELGTSRLVGRQVERAEAALDEVAAGGLRGGGPIPLWDGRASERIADIVASEGI
jgi:UDP-N-acetylglucosamine 2-epimerase (non-hydrolysing)